MFRFAQHDNFGFYRVATQSPREGRRGEGQWPVTDEMGNADRLGALRGLLRVQRGLQS